jgi:O-antigen ligase
MFMDKPLFGWGAINKNIELGSRIGYPGPRDAHNLYLHILIESGLSGAIPFFSGLWLCWHAAWRARRGKQGVLPIAMLGLFLIVNMKGTYLIDKLFWIVLAYALASNHPINYPRAQKGLPPQGHSVF